MFGNSDDVFRDRQSGSGLAIARASFGNAICFNKGAIRIRYLLSPWHYSGSFLATAKALFGSVICNCQNNILQNHLPQPLRHWGAFLSRAGARFGSITGHRQSTFADGCLPLQMRNLESAFCNSQGLIRQHHLPLHGCHSGLATAKAKFGIVHCHSQGIHHSEEQLSTASARFNSVPAHREGKFGSAPATAELLFGNVARNGQSVIRERPWQQPIRNSGLFLAAATMPLRNAIGKNKSAIRERL